MDDREIHSAADFAAPFAILAFVADAQKSEARLRELAAKSAEAKELIKQANAAHAALDARRQEFDKRLRTELAAHEHHMAKQVGDWETAQAAREKDLKLREAHANRLLAKASEDAAAAAKLRSEVEKRIAAVHAAAA
jgi:hypothetical protein